ncbi:hypothetical protein [Microcoleus sp. bin38.metabat.b11b12b14.051]|uniref:hypothetical protein n=1 Tax=Microcoleus sp. bin38.metabat.b11b12b14.051 TaxID=2742709 RepID=UPI0025D722A7|nr:hypothetical protein [Microcoleus sp. bin38.metabat.b11b12b14.051]
MLGPIASAIVPILDVRVARNRVFHENPQVPARRIGKNPVSLVWKCDREFVRLCAIGFVSEAARYN